ncbi:OmpA family protein [Ketobacter sp.]|uniref:OmpA family protein n=1 Tax=Ketobacter sp. TaxID=2083498 RepID=UPI000F130BAA|nr:OmpA family protein [Ketobacter sp.]RLU00221.1 MAG: OmpA family protein [Ketobacter sp.]
MKRIILPVSLCLLAGHALAENKEGQIVINPAVSYIKFDNDRLPDEADGFGLGLEYRFGPNWAAEVAAFRNDADQGVDLTQYKLDGLYYFSKDGTVQPYLGAGIGHADFERGDADEGETQVNLGGGLRFNFSEAWSARWDLRGIYGVDDNDTDLMTTLGISYAFGGESKPEPKKEVVVAAPVDSDGDGVTDDKDQCPGTAAGVKVDATGCPLDSDGDGVTDDKDQCPNTEAGATVDEKGCVGKVQTVTVESIELKINFPTNSDVIQSQYDPELKKVADFLNKHTDLEVEIEGHTDSQGAAAYNKTLSQKRADSVKRALVKRFGVAEERITAVGYGEENPIATNDTADGRKQNRRVVAVMQKEVMQ